MTQNSATKTSEKAPNNYSLCIKGDYSREDTACATFGMNMCCRMSRVERLITLTDKRICKGDNDNQE